MRAAVPHDTFRPLTAAARLVSVAVICAILYWGQIVLIPIALAALVTFLMSPLVTRLSRWGLPRVLAVLVVAGTITGLLGGLGYVVGGQLGQLAAELPQYRQNIRAKVADLRAMTRGGTFERVQQAIEDISQDIEQDAAADAEAQERASPSASPSSEEPVRVEIERDWLPADTSLLGPLLQGAATGGLAMLLSIFMLLKREDLRNRLVSLAGETSLAITTKAFAEAGERISRFLLMQFVINATMGLAVGTGLYLLGVPYAALWGLSAAVLRYIPYAGPWIAALLPIAVSVVTAPGWEQVALVIGLFIVLELLSNNVMEPWLYGHSVGLSAIAVIVSAIFWTWLWGPVGLLLATPITACIVVLSRYIPGLAVFDRLLSERPALQPHLWLYQRLLAGDHAEAADIVKSHLAKHSLAETFEQLLLGTLVALKRDLAAGRVTADDGDSVAGALRAIIADTAARDESPPDRAEDGVPPLLLIGFPVSDQLDEIALELAALLLREESCTLEMLSPEMLVGERVAIVAQRQPAAVCVASVSPGDSAASRHARKRLRARLPGLRVIVATLGGTPPLSAARIGADDARRVAYTFAELRDALKRAVRDIEPSAADDEASSGGRRSAPAPAVHAAPPSELA